MTLEEVKVIRIVDYLNNKGIAPQKVRGNQYWYSSPIREDKDPSFKVDDGKNLWYDYGEGHGGNLIELGKYLYNTKDVHAIIKHIEENAPVGSFFRQSPPRMVQEPVKKDEIVYHYQPLSHHVLCSYIASRLINVKIAMKYCQEVHFVCGKTPCYGIAFPNDSGYYEMRNAKFKRCIGKKDISTIIESEHHSTISLFEGFMDFLSFKTMMLCNPTFDNYRGDYLVMNSVANLKKTLEKIKHYSSICLYLDNDAAGRNATKAIQKEYGDKVYDYSNLFAPYKDVNDYLMHQPKLFGKKDNE